MKYGTSLVAGVLLLSALAAQAEAGPKRRAPVRLSPEAAAQALLSESTFISYDVGTLRMSGKSRSDASYSIGTLRLTGKSPAATLYSIGTLRMSGARSGQ